MRIKTAFLLLILVIAGCIKAPSLERDIFPSQAQVQIDEAIHPRNSLEWWYATGWLQDSLNGDTFGVEFVIFHFNLDGKTDRLLTNIAITDPKANAFYFDHAFQKEDELLKAQLPLNLDVNNKRCFANLSGAFGNYMILGKGEMDRTSFGYHLNLNTAKPPVMHGGGTGIELYGDFAKAGYYSYTDLDCEGVLYIGDEVRTVAGKMWYDRQWNCASVLQERSTGWDWASITLDQTGEQVMLYRLRQGNGNTILGGTLIQADGSYEQLKPNEIRVKDLNRWESPSSKDSYPLHLEVELLAHDIEFQLEAVVENQELKIGILPGLNMHYWEGMCKVSGTSKQVPVTGKAYLEITNPENKGA